MTRRLAEVARKVGVSEATVSRVLNGKPGVAESTRQAVLTALDVLGYERPTKLRGERARLVGLVLPELQNPIFPAFAEVMGVALAQRGLHAGPVHPDRGRRVGGRLRRAPAPAAGLGGRVRRRPVRAGGRAARPLRAARRARPADRPRQRLDRRASASRASRATTRSRSSRRWGTSSRSATRAIGVLAGPADHMPSNRKVAAAQAVAEAGRASRCGRTRSPASLVLDRGCPGRRGQADRGRRDRASCAPAT